MYLDLCRGVNEKPHAVTLCFSSQSTSHGGGICMFIFFFFFLKEHHITNDKARKVTETQEDTYIVHKYQILMYRDRFCADRI